MAPFTISPPHQLPYQGHLPQEALFIQSKMSPELSYKKPEVVLHHLKTSIIKMKLRLWQLVVNCCMSAIELFSSKMLFFICVGRKIAMMGALKKSGVEALESPETREEDLDVKSPEMEFEEVWESEEDSELEDVDSDWSDEDEDEDNSEASAESLELWESFLNNADPYNPLSFCSSTSSKTSTSQKLLTNRQIRTQPSPDPEESQPKPDSKNSRKKVCFSERVTVRPLLVWNFASRAARDGSCWLQMARDRDRFKRRVEKLELVLKPCLMPEHRDRVWRRLQNPRKHTPDSCL